jgi:aspartate/methionine/tyrosine aminotransferase
MADFPANPIASLVGKAPRYDLGVSYGPHARFGELQASGSSLADLILGYRTAPGDARLRESIAQIYDATADDVIVTVGSMHALFLLAFVLCDRDDEAVITTPIYPPSRSTLDAVGAKVRALPLSFEQRYQVDPGAVAQLLSPKTKLVSVASPQNPSGINIPWTTQQDLARLISLKSPQAYFLVDDIYRESAIGQDAIAPSPLALGDKVIGVGSLSKSYGVPGLRLGWIVTRDAALRERLVRAKFNTVISCPAIDEELAQQILARRETIVAERRVLLSRSLDAMRAWAAENASLFEWLRPDAGAICVARLRPDAVPDSEVEAFYRELENLGVRVARGAWFGDEARVLRIGYAHLPVRDLQQGLTSLTEAANKAARR